MGPIDLFFHLLNFVAPALVLGGLVAVLGRFFIKKATYPGTLRSQFAINSIVGVAVLLAGLVLLGRDGKMATYFALVLGIATSQWVQSRGWQ